MAGFGRVGHRIGEIFSIAEIPFIALDSDASIVEEEKRKGHPIFYGDVCNPKILKAAGASNAKVIIVTLNDFEAAEELVLTLRKIYPNVSIYVRGHSLSNCIELKRLGASGVVSENLEASLELARMALGNIGFDASKKENILEEFHRDYYVQIDEVVRSETTQN